MEGVGLRVKNEGMGVKGGGGVLHLFKSEEWRVGSDGGGEWNPIGNWGLHANFITQVQPLLGEKYCSSPNISCVSEFF